MTDRELLELAAKAAGIKIDPIYTDQHPPTSLPNGYLVIINESGGHSFWNPLADDGDLYQLLSKLKMIIDFDTQIVMVGEICIRWPEDEPDEARAITRAAAEIVKRSI